MNMSSTPTDKLIALLKDDKVIPIIGAGVSSAATGLPSWSGLIKSGIEYAESKNIDEKGLINKAKIELANGNYLRASNYVKELLNAPKFPFMNWINDTFKDLNIFSKDLINNILDLSTPIIATTNYDTLLSSIDNLSNRKRFVHSEYQEAINAIKSKHDCIIHLHGVYEKPESIILSENDYSELNNNFGYKELIKKMLSDYHLLFIGCSKDGVMDEDFSTVFEFIKKWMSYCTNQHFILLHEKEIRAKNHIGLLTECNIEAISYGNDYSLLSEFISKINPNKDKKKLKLKMYEKNLKEEFTRLDAKESFDTFFSKNFNSKYDWVDSEKMQIFEKLFSDYNSNITEKKEKLIFTQNIIQSIFNVSELKEKIELWNEYRSTPSKLNPLNYINTAILAYECLLKIPKEIINDLQYSNYKPIHDYFFDGYLGGFIYEVKQTKKQNIDLDKIYNDDDYLFENLKRILQSLKEFLELDPNSFYEKIEKATIINVLPNSFFIVVTNEEITLRNETKLQEIYARLPLERIFAVQKIEIVKKGGQIYIIGFNSKHCFYWQPETNISKKVFYNSEQLYGISDIFCEINNSDIIVRIKSGQKIIKFINFIEDSTQKLDESFYQVLPLGNGYIGLKHVANNHKGPFLYRVNFNGKSKSILSLEGLIPKIEEDRNISSLIRKYQPKHEYQNLIDSIKIQKIFFKNKELFLLLTRFILDKMTSLIIIIEIESYEIKFLNILHLNYSTCVSVDFFSKNNILELICGYLDLNYDENLCEYIKIEGNKIVSSETIQLKRENENIRDVHSVVYINEKSVIVNEESKRLITISLPKKIFQFYDFPINERINYIKYYESSE